MFLTNVWQTTFAQIDLKKATVTLSDGAGTPNTLVMTIGEGNLTYTERRNIDYTLDRGILDEVREGDEVPVEVSMDATWEFIDSDDSPEKFMKGGIAGAVSSDADTCRPFAIDILIVYTPDCGDSGITESISLLDFRYEQIDHDLRGGTFSFSGRCNITMATITGTYE